MLPLSENRGLRHEVRSRRRILLVSASGVAAAHPCDQDAIERATPLLKLQFDAGDDEVENLAIDDTVKTLAPVRALKGSGKFDVLEVWGHIYKADYRMRFIYAQGDELLPADGPGDPGSERPILSRDVGLDSGRC